MKFKNWTLSIITLLLVSATVFAVEPGQSVLNLQVKGMKCGGCESKVKGILKDVKGVVSTEKVSASEGRVVVIIDDSRTTKTEVASTLADKSGYDVSVLEGKSTSYKGNKNAPCCSGKSKSSCQKK